MAPAAAATGNGGEIGVKTFHLRGREPLFRRAFDKPQVELLWDLPP